jgi:holo-[acyl-carrier protein] synthase
MIWGIGNDVVELARVRAVWDRNGRRFVERVLGAEEQRILDARGARSQARALAFLATRFAAKEAISKAIGLGMRWPMSWRSVEIVPAPSGRPQAVAHGELRAFLEERRLRLHVSVSDLESLAFATAVAEVLDPPAP